MKSVIPSTDLRSYQILTIIGSSLTIWDLYYAADKMSVEVLAVSIFAKPFFIIYALYLYFLVLSLRCTSKAIKPFEERSYVAIWYWIQEFNPKNIFPNKKNSRIIA